MNKYTYTNGQRRKRMTVICKTCKCKFSPLWNTKLGIYCSRTCSGKGRTTKKKVPCAICSNLITRSQAELNRTKVSVCGDACWSEVCRRRKKSMLHSDKTPSQRTDLKLIRSIADTSEELYNKHIFNKHPPYLETCKVGLEVSPKEERTMIILYFMMKHRGWGCKDFHDVGLRDKTHALINKYVTRRKDLHM